MNLRKNIAYALLWGTAALILAWIWDGDWRFGATAGVTFVSGVLIAGSVKTLEMKQEELAPVIKGTFPGQRGTVQFGEQVTALDPEGRFSVNIPTDQSEMEPGRARFDAETFAEKMRNRKNKDD